MILKAAWSTNRVHNSQCYIERNHDLKNQNKKTTKKNPKNQNEQKKEGKMILKNHISFTDLGKTNYVDIVMVNVI